MRDRKLLLSGWEQGQWGALLEQRCFWDAKWKHYVSRDSYQWKCWHLKSLQGFWRRVFCCIPKVHPCAWSHTGRPHRGESWTRIITGFRCVPASLSIHCAASLVILGGSRLFSVFTSLSQLKESWASGSSVETQGKSEAKQRKKKPSGFLFSFCSMLIYISSCGGDKMLIDILAPSHLHGSRETLSL